MSLHIPHILLPKMIEYWFLTSVHRVGQAIMRPLCWRETIIYCGDRWWETVTWRGHSGRDTVTWGGEWCVV